MSCQTLASLSDEEIGDATGKAGSDRGGKCFRNVALDVALPCQFSTACVDEHEMQCRATTGRVRRERHLNGNQRVASIEQSGERAQLTRKRFTDVLFRIALDGRERIDRNLIGIDGVAGIPFR